MGNQESGRRLAILGCGFMGTAILQGLLNKDKTDGQTSQYTACVRSEASIKRLQNDIIGFEDRVKVSGLDGLVPVTKEADVVMLGCVPGDLDSLFQTPGLVEALRQKLVISLLAGVSTSQLAAGLRGTEVREESADKVKSTAAEFSIGRVIPSIGAKIGDSVTLLAQSEWLPDGKEKTVLELFERVGSVVTVAEKLMDDATAIGAACHALSIQAVDAITDASVADGMDRNTAMQLAAESLRSSSNLFCAGGMTPEQLKAAMSTPGGITINSVLSLQSANVPSGIASSVRAAIQYARNM